MANLSGKFSESKLPDAHAGAARDFHRAARKVARAECRAAAVPCRSFASEAIIPMMGEDHDAHVQAFEAWDFGYALARYIDDRDDREGCGCGLCLGDNGIISTASGLRIYLRSGRPCALGLTPEILGYYGPMETYYGPDAE